MAKKEYISIDTAYDIGTFDDWYINSVSQDNAPVWTEEHLEELLKDFYVIPKDTPTADVTPVRHGHWYNRGGRFRCSVCDNKAFLKDIGGTGGWSHEYEQQKSPYCPHCGALMDGGEGND